MLSSSAVHSLPSTVLVGDGAPLLSIKPLTRFSLNQSPLEEVETLPDFEDSNLISRMELSDNTPTYHMDETMQDHDLNYVKSNGSQLANSSLMELDSMTQLHDMEHHSIDLNEEEMEGSHELAPEPTQLVDPMRDEVMEDSPAPYVEPPQLVSTKVEPIATISIPEEIVHPAEELQEFDEEEHAEAARLKGELLASTPGSPIHFHPSTFSEDAASSQFLNDEVEGLEFEGNVSLRVDGSEFRLFDSTFSNCLFNDAREVESLFYDGPINDFIRKVKQHFQLTRIEVALLFENLDGLTIHEVQCDFYLTFACCQCANSWRPSLGFM
jgi:hypothetical protein